MGSCASTGYDDKVKTVDVNTDVLVWSKDTHAKLDATHHERFHKIIKGHCVDAEVPLD